MQDIFNNYKKTGYLHHAHIILGAHDAVAPLLIQAIEEHLGIKSKGNPDLTIKFYQSFGIDEARELKSAERYAGFGGTKKIFIIGADSFTHQAQNALLKTLEEPTEETHFFIITPRKETLLPTLLSRVTVVYGNISGVDVTETLALKFIDGSLEERFAIAKKMAEKKAGETVDRELFRRMFDSIERSLHARTVGKRNEATVRIFSEIFEAKTHLANPGSSPKMLLENIAIYLSVE